VCAVAAALTVWLEGIEAAFLAHIVTALLPIVTGKAVDDEAVWSARINLN
jgi:hypothetical protein